MLRLASPFQDHAILQRDRPLPVWGWTLAGHRVRATLDGHSALTEADETGAFFLALPPCPAGGPHTLEVVAFSAGDVAHPGFAVTLRDVLVGEVWLASGQSNMEWKLEQCGDLGAAASAAADDSALRFFTVRNRARVGARPLADGAWLPATPKNAPGFSAVAYHFAARLRRETGVPVGILCAAWGGTRIEAWMSRSALSRLAFRRDEAAADLLHAHSPARWALADSGSADLLDRRPRDPGNLGLKNGWHEPAHDTSGWAGVALPAHWQAFDHPGCGVHWFRREIQLPADWTGRPLVLRLGAVDKQDITYVNGREIGRMGSGLEDRHWNIPRVYPVPAELSASGRLVIAVRAYSFIYNGGLSGPADAMRIELADAPDSPSLPLAGAWAHRIEHDFGVIDRASVPGDGNPNSPHILHDNLIAPLAPYALRGALWYQGEANTGHARLYPALQRALIEDWRRAWGEGDFPFLITQLPRFLAPSPYKGDSWWADFRQAQREAADSLPAVHLAVTLDCGEADDIHPKDKAPVGERLARLALVHVHGRELPSTGPVLKHVVREGSALRAHFLRPEHGLRTRDGAPPRTVFLLASDGSAYPAEARIEHDTLVASHPELPAPAALAYAWSDNPADNNLVNRDGLPAAPFRAEPVASV